MGALAGDRLLRDVVEGPLRRVAVRRVLDCRAPTGLPTPLVRGFLAIVLVASVVPAATAAGGVAGRVRIVAWAGSATKAGLPPRDAVSGGTYCTSRAIRRLYAFVRFSGMRDRVRSSASWYFNGKRVYVYRFRWEDGQSGRTAFNLYRTKGVLLAGRYTIEVRAGSRLVGRDSVRLKFGSC